MKLFGVGNFLQDLEYHTRWVVQLQQIDDRLREIAMHIRVMKNDGTPVPRTLTKEQKELVSLRRSVEGSVEFTWRRSFYPHPEEKS